MLNPFASPSTFPSSLEESFELLNPLFIAADKAHKHHIYQNILYQQHPSHKFHSSTSSNISTTTSSNSNISISSSSTISSPTTIDSSPSDVFDELCSVCLSDFVKGMKDTEERYKLMMKQYDQTLNLYFLNSTSNPTNQSKKLISNILELEGIESDLNREIKDYDLEINTLDDELFSIQQEIEQYTIDINCAEQDYERSEQEIHDTASLIESTRTEISLLSQTLSSKSLYSMNWKTSLMIQNSPDPLMNQSTLSSFLATSINSVFSSPLASPSMEQKILGVNRIRITYCPISSKNLNWGEICMGWSVVGTFLQGYLNEMKWICRQIPTSHDPSSCCTFEMILLRGKLVFNDLRQCQDREIYSERNLYRLYCTEEELISSQKQVSLEDYGSSLEYQIALLCLGITIVEITDIFKHILHSYWKASHEEIAEIKPLLECPSLVYLKSLSHQQNFIHQWPTLHHLLQHFPNKLSFINLVNDILLVVYNLHTISPFQS